MSGKCQGILGNCGLCQGILTVACVVSFKIRENAYFAIWNFKIFSGVTPPNPHNKLLTLKTLLMPPRVLARKRIRCRGGGADQITCLLLCTTCQGIFRQTAWNVREMSRRRRRSLMWLEERQHKLKCSAVTIKLQSDQLIIQESSQRKYWNN